MGASPSRPTAEQLEELEAIRADAIERAGAVIAQSDALVLMTGAGWSADSGLAVYADVANVQAYHDRGLTYHDICNPSWLDSEPELFYGFWGKCFNDYREDIIARWRTQLFRGSTAAAQLRQASGAPGAFFCYTSNVDAHSLLHFAPTEVRECHGNSETWQCASRRCPGVASMDDGSDGTGADGCDEAHGTHAATDEDRAAPLPTRWPAPAGFRFAVDPRSALALEGAPAKPASSGRGASAFEHNWPRCIGCGGKARPSILMFGDGKWHDDEPQAERWQAWRAALEQLASERGASFRVTIVEVGAGGNVTTVRNLAEDVLSSINDAGGTATLVRINPELPLADRPENQPRTFSVLSKGLDAVRAIDNAVSRALRAQPADARHEESSLTPPRLSTLDEPPAPAESEPMRHQPDAADLSQLDIFERFDALKGRLSTSFQRAAGEIANAQHLLAAGGAPELNEEARKSGRDDSSAAGGAQELPADT